MPNPTDEAVSTASWGSAPSSSRATTSSRLALMSSRTSLSCVSSTERTSSQPAVPTATAVTSIAASVMRTRTDCSGWSQRGHRPAGPERAGLATVDQPVAADGPHRLERTPPERRVDLAAQVADVDLDHVVVAREVLAPHLPQEFDLRHALPLVAEQGLEQRVLATGPVDGHVAPPARPGDRVQR